ncbi:MAG: 4Fe-4S dicluster domain-containing protein [Coriobacteriales bacterium]|jgi:anaerobic dimethyl sulfoxide reductase subunit B (iron-sulfur subunit)|nr:4Fe-4S dicluster domain-containing protein [Coriobacteriales bacterium]
MGQLAFFVNSDICIGCKCCEAACKDIKDLPLGPRPRFVRDFVGGEWKVDVTDPTLYRQEGVFIYHVSVSCNHCANPACVAICPVGSMTKDPETGIVSNDLEACIGCGSCYDTCPYKAPQILESDMKAYKCDFCKDLLEADEKPACVATCPMRALDYGEHSDLMAANGDACDVAPLPSSEETGPSLVLKLHREAKMDKSDGYSTSLYVSDR